MYLKVAKELGYTIEEIKDMEFAKTYALYYGLLVLEGSVKPSTKLTNDEKELMQHLGDINMDELQSAVDKFLG